MPKLTFNCVATFTLKDGTFKTTKIIKLECYSLSGAIIDFCKLIKPVIVKNKLTGTKINITSDKGDNFKQQIN